MVHAIREIWNAVSVLTLMLVSGVVFVLWTGFVIIGFILLIGSILQCLF